MTGAWLSTWWLWWAIFMFAFLVLPMGYGWGYRGWGAPYPRYVQRRRGQRAIAVTSSRSFNHHSWGWGGDFVWIAMVVGVLWAVSAYGWLR